MYESLAVNPLPLLVALSLTGSLIAFADGWRLTLLALSAQYVLVGVLLAQAVPRELALVKVVVGGFICAILFITKRQRNTGPRLGLVQVAALARLRLPRLHTQSDGNTIELSRDNSPASSEKTEHKVGNYVWTKPVGQEPSPSFRRWERRLMSLALPGLLVLTLALASITLTGLWQQYSPIPPPGVTGLAAVWMMGIGLLSLASRRTAFHIGLGLLTLVTGFEVAYTSLEPSLFVAGLLGLLNIVISLAVAWIEAVALPLESNP